MSWHRKPPTRQPHPDPAVELQLLRILDLRGSIARQAELVGEYRHSIRGLHSAVRAETSSKRIELMLKEAEAVHDRILATEANVAAIGEQITKLQAEIPADDLLYLAGGL